ncbi:hypothetical protein QBC47DRAFT_393959 [Echria macrotheca]|uniref:Uncharacterized protein n=1 Tax=Echria macrotheca TaxID=438768 RepID=A0AAJ0B376_9PEZI|nr:hypothetical protein QBC47DRAFT_393959 [Echria macrotheca]
MSLLAGFIYRQFIHEPPVPTESYEGRTVIVTGANQGLGLEAVRWMVKLKASRVILACRSLEKGEAAIADICSTTRCPPEKLAVWRLDMASYASVQAFADKVNSELPRLDAIVLNAGVIRRTFHLAEDNEETITTNVVSLALLAFLIHPKLRETHAKFGVTTHLTVTGSELYESASFRERKAPPGKLFERLADKNTLSMDRYDTSKLLVLFFIREFATLYPVDSTGVVINIVAPGFCGSQLGREWDSRAARAATKALARPAEVGARTLVYGASASKDTHGQYLPDCKITQPNRGLAKGKAGEELQKRVWTELKTKLETIRPGVTMA